MSDAILNIVKQGFEQQKKIIVISLYYQQNRIEGVYILPLQQSLSFLQMPLLDMATHIDKYDIYMDELGQLLQGAYHYGDLFAYVKLVHKSAINYENKLLNELLNECKNNPPFPYIRYKFIEWLEMTDDVTLERTQSFIRFCHAYNEIDDNIEFDDNLADSNAAYILNQFHDVIQQLKERKGKKITELTMNRIDDLFIKLQIDLYITENNTINNK